LGKHLTFSALKYADRSWNESCTFEDHSKASFQLHGKTMEHVPSNNAVPLLRVPIHRSVLTISSNHHFSYITDQNCHTDHPFRPTQQCHSDDIGYVDGQLLSVTNGKLSAFNQPKVDCVVLKG
jgi:hypothetical protein